MPPRVSLTGDRLLQSALVNMHALAVRNVSFIPAGRPIWGINKSEDHLCGVARNVNEV